MRITRTSAHRSCAICERTLLLGERVTRFSPDGRDEYVDVCPLCLEIALEHGWVKEGQPTTPTVGVERRRRRGLNLGSILTPPRGGGSQPASDPVLAGLSERERGLVEAADVFNASQFRRTIEGIAKSLGPPRASVVALSGPSGEHVVTVAWDLSWYQYRVSFEPSRQVRLVERGTEIEELDEAYTAWNAELSLEGRILPDVLVGA